VPTDGACFHVIAVNDRTDPIELWSRCLDPARVLDDQGLQTTRIPLPDGLLSRLVFRIDAGPKNDASSDWTYWAEPRLTPVPTAPTGLAP
jgi:hypothetical protein